MSRKQATFGPQISGEARGKKKNKVLGSGGKFTSKMDALMYTIKRTSVDVFMENIYDKETMNRIIYDCFSIITVASGQSSGDEPAKVVRSCGPGFYTLTMPEKVVGGTTSFSERLLRADDDFLTPLLSHVSLDPSEGRRRLAMFAYGDDEVVSSVERTVNEVLDPLNRLVTVKNTDIEKESSWLSFLIPKKNPPKAKFTLLVGLFEDELEEGAFPVASQEGWEEVSENKRSRWKHIQNKNRPEGDPGEKQ